MSRKSQMLMEYSGLIFGCPLKDDVHDCAFRKLRNLELKERLNYWKNLSEVEKRELINHHLVCIFNRERIHIDYANLTLVTEGNSNNI